MNLDLQVTARVEEGPDLVALYLERPLRQLLLSSAGVVRAGVRVAVLAQNTEQRRIVGRATEHVDVVVEAQLRARVGGVRHRRSLEHDELDAATARQGS